jgi:hypothetical protein
MRLLVLFSLLSLTAVCGAQAVDKAAGAQDASKSADAQLSPEAAYEHAAAPVDITHRDVANWSDIELTALSVAIDQAKTACIEREQVKYTGDDLMGYAKLCALGQMWPDVYRAATQYINSGDKERPLLPQAYSFEVQADLNMRQPKDALGASIAMLKVVPYCAVVDDVTTAAVRYMQFSATEDAYELLMTRQRVLLGLLRGAQPDVGDWPTEPTVSPIPLHTVVQHALDYAALSQYMGSKFATGIVKDIDGAMPKDLPPDEAILIAAERRQYDLLGTKMPELKGAVSLMGAPEALLAKPVFGAVTVFLLFPPWCAQCVRLGPQLQPAMEREHGSSGLKVYALLADTPPEPPKRVAGKNAADASALKRTAHAAEHAAEETAVKSPADLLRKTPTLVVPPSTLDVFGAADFPFLIATDHDGVIRLLYPAAPNDALVEGGIVDQMTLDILSHWPPQRPKPSGSPVVH